MINSLEERMKKSIAALKSELATVRTGRASISLLDHITVNYYNSEMPLNQVATLSVPEPRMILITPWEKSVIPVIEKAILGSDLGLNPSNDGAAIRIILPELTEERRREFVRQVRQYGEKAKVAVRNIRRDANDDVKRKIKDEGVSEDESKRLSDQIQKVTDHYIHEIDQVIEHKEKDILTI
jgi:ribosome recycling factor